MNKIKHQITICTLILLSSIISQCFAWIGEGHDSVTRRAINISKEKLPVFFSNGAAIAAHCSGDPDIFKILKGSQLKDRETPEHYIDIELLHGQTLPKTRKQFAQLCIECKTSPDKIGTVPYSIIEWTQRLTIAFAEYRKWPENEIIQLKCLVYAGNLSHYAGDLCMPLHTTINYDGRVTDNNSSSPETGIHLKVDALLHKIPDCNNQTKEENVQLTPYTDLWGGIMKELEMSHGQVEQVYAMENELPSLNEPIKCGTKVCEFTKQKHQETSQFVGRLFLTAWADSEKVKMPVWNHREEKANLPGKTKVKQNMND